MFSVKEMLGIAGGKSHYMQHMQFHGNECGITSFADHDRLCIEMWTSALVLPINLSSCSDFLNPLTSLHVISCVSRSLEIRTWSCSKCNIHRLRPHPQSFPHCLTSSEPDSSDITSWLWIKPWFLRLSSLFSLNWSGRKTVSLRYFRTSLDFELPGYFKMRGLTNEADVFGPLWSWMKVDVCSTLGLALMQRSTLL